MRWTSLVFQVLAAPGSVCLLLGLATSTTPAAPPEPSRQPEVYAFCFDTHDAAKRDLPRQAMMLRDLGYDAPGTLDWSSWSSESRHSTPPACACIWQE